MLIARSTFPYVTCGYRIDAPICQDTCSGGLGAALAHAEVCHNALVEFTSKEAFEASNDLAPTLFRRFANLGRFVAPYALAATWRTRWT